MQLHGVSSRIDNNNTVSESRKGEETGRVPRTGRQILQKVPNFESPPILRLQLYSIHYCIYMVNTVYIYVYVYDFRRIVCVQ